MSHFLLGRRPLDRPTWARRLYHRLFITQGEVEERIRKMVIESREHSLITFDINHPRLP